MNRTYIIPGAIALAGIVLALSIYVVRTHHTAIAEKGSPDQMRPLSSGDHIIGKPDAPVMIVEYADIDSEFGKAFQPVLEQLMTEYAEGGKVAWAYRHFPLIDQDENAETHAEAAECAASIAGPHAFWTFIDSLQAAAPGAAQFDPSDYDLIARSAGVPFETLDTCLKEHRFANKVAEDGRDALSVGATGSPHTVILIRGEKKPITIDGAISYLALKKIVDQAIEKAH